MYLHRKYINHKLPSKKYPSYDALYPELSFNTSITHNWDKNVYKRLKESMVKALSSDVVQLYVPLGSILGILIVFTLYGL